MDVNVQTFISITLLKRIISPGILILRVAEHHVMTTHTRNTAGNTARFSKSIQKAEIHKASPTHVKQEIEEKHAGTYKRSRPAEKKLFLSLHKDTHVPHQEWSTESRKGRLRKERAFQGCTLFYAAVAESSKLKLYMHSCTG